MKEIVKKVKKFIDDNNLLEGSDSSINSDIVIICGLIDYFTTTDKEIVLSYDNIISKLLCEIPRHLWEKVSKHAYINNYGEWWKDKSNRSKYTYDEDFFSKG